MNVLFVSSGNNPRGISPVVKNQGDSLSRAGIHIDYFTISGKGWSGYLKNIFSLRRFLKRNKYDLIHAHYALSAVCAGLANHGLPMVASLMGSDLMLGRFWNRLIRFFSEHVWWITIVKSTSMKNSLRTKQVMVIPNGVDLDLYKPLPKDECRQRIQFKGVKNILFIGDPNRLEKNFDLARKAVETLNNNDVCLHVLNGIAPAEMPYYYNAADLLLLTSRWEGSPNAVKEAMACNLPVVATAVGDVPDLIGDVQGCYLCTADAADIAAKIHMVFDLHSRSEGRNKLIKMGLDSQTIARKVINLYNQLKIKCHPGGSRDPGSSPG
jgi:teichuronic acid biosynthesis glycosyltransferase TuaC